jgi:hypothetical protein
MAMSWFSRKRKTRFPADMLHRLEALGRFHMNSESSGIDSTYTWEECILPFREIAKADPEGFLIRLRALVADDTGGFATYGAYRLYDETIGHTYRSATALAIMDDAIAFKRARGLPSASLTGFEWARWCEQHSAESWWS